FLGPQFNAGNLRDRSIAEIWHHSQGFRSIRALPGPEEVGAATADRPAVFTEGCRARALFFNGSINAPDPWVTARKETDEAPSRTGAMYHPLVILEVAGTARRVRG